MASIDDDFKHMQMFSRGENVKRGDMLGVFRCCDTCEAIHFAVCKDGVIITEVAISEEAAKEICQRIIKSSIPVLGALH